MSEYHFVLNVDVAKGLEPQARMWIDDPSGDLASEREVVLVRDSESQWSGTFSARGAFIYRVGIVAAPGSCWSLVFNSLGDDERELLFDSDELTMAKEWLVGSCEEIEAPLLRPSREILRPQLLSS